MSLAALTGATDLDRPGASASARGSAGSYLIAQFREFHAQLTAMAEVARRTGSPPDDGEDDDEANVPPVPGGQKPASPFIGPAAPPLPSDFEPKPPPLPKTADDAAGGPTLSPGQILDRLQSLLERQALESGRQGGEFGVIYYREAQYVMAVLADEMFLRMDWAGRAQWNRDLLETRLFGSYNAGDEFFRRLDRLLKDGERAQAELAAVYLLALAFGFKGRYRGSTHAARLADYRRRLYRDIYHRDPGLLAETTDLCPDAYAHTAAEAEPRLLPAPTRWFWVLGAVIVAYIALGHWLWDNTVEPLETELSIPVQGDPAASRGGSG